MVLNDLKQIRKVPTNAPVYAVALLVAVASEALSRLEGRSVNAVFVEEMFARAHSVPSVVARVLFDAVRNGLAHVYDTKTIVLGAEEVIVVLSWADRPHLSVATEDWIQDGKPRRAICLNVGTLCADLEAYFERLMARLERDADFSRRVAANASNQKPPAPEAEALRAWREYLAQQQGT